MKLSTLVLFLLLISFSSFPAWSASHITLQGRLLKSDGLTPVIGNVSFRIQIRSPGVENCLLYEETNSFNTTNTGGSFSLTVGSGTRAAANVDGGYPLEKIFNNKSEIDLSGAPGACDGGNTSYTPSPTDGRILVYSFNDGLGWQTVPPMAVNWVPMAFEAYSVGGFTPDNILRVEDALGNPAVIAALTPAQATELLALSLGTSTNYVTPGNASFTAAPTYGGAVSNANHLTNKDYVDNAITTAIGSFDGDNILTGTIGGNTAINTSGNIVTTGVVSGSELRGTTLRIYNGANYVQFTTSALGGNNVEFFLPNNDGDPGQVLSTDGNGILTWINPATGSVTNVTASAPLSSSGGATPDISISKADATTDGYLSSTDWNTFNDKLGTTTAFSGDVSGSYNATSVDKIKGTGIDFSVAPANGNILKFDGTNWVPVSIASGDVPNLDASKITTGILPIARGGTGATSIEDGKLVIGGNLGATYANFDCTQGQVMAFNALGQVVCENTGGANQLLRLDNTASTSIAGSFGMGGNFAVTGASTLSGNTTVGGALGVTGNTTLSADLSVGGDTTLTGDLNANGNINMAASKVLGLSQHAADPGTSGWGAAEKGRTWFNSTSNEIKYWDGSAVRVLGAVGGAVTSVTATPGSPIVIGGTSVSPTVGIEKADSTTDGYLSSTDWNTFNNKLGTSLNDGQIWVGDGSHVATPRTPSGDVTMSHAGVFSVEKIRGTNVSINSLTGGDFLKFDGTNWVNSPLASGDIPNLDAAKITSGTLDAGRLPAFSGDVTTSTGSSVTTVEKLQTYPLNLSTPPTIGKVLKFNGTAWVADDDNATDATKLPLAGGTMIGAIDMDGNNILKAGNIEMSASKLFGLSQHTTDPSTAGWGAAEKGRTWFNTTNNEIKYWDGGAIRVLGVAGSGISSFNGSNENSQTLSLGTTGNSPSWDTNTGTGVHTLNIPLASTSGVTAGLISNAKYEEFDAKLDATATFSGDVSGAYNNTSVDKIKGTVVSISSLTSGNLLRFDGTNWVNTNLSTADIPDLDTGKITSGVLPIARGGTNNGSLDVTNGGIIYTDGSKLMNSGAGTSGKALISGGAGTPTWGTLGVSGGGTGATSFTADAVIISNISGTGLTSLNCTSGQVLKFGVTGNAYCGTDNGGTGTEFINAGNSFGSPAILGTNDNQPLHFETNGTNKVTILADGKVGIGTTSPSHLLSLTHDFGAGTYSEGISITTAHSTGGLWYGPLILGRSSKGTLTAPATSGGSQVLLRLQGDANYNGNFNNAAHIELLTDGVPSFNSYPGKIIFSTTPSGSTSPQERMKITASGYVGIGAEFPDTKLHVKGSTADGVYTSTIEVTNQHGEFMKFKGANGLTSIDVGNQYNMPFIQVNDDVGTKRVVLDAWGSRQSHVTIKPSSSAGVDATATSYWGAIHIEMENTLNFENGLTWGDSDQGFSPYAAVTAYDTDGGSFRKGGLRFKTNPGNNNLTTRMTIDQNGKVGIGTSPNETLEVAGNIKATGGQIFSAAQTSSAGSPLTFNANLGNTMVWTTNAATPTVNVHNMKPGATYMLVVHGTGTGTVTINCYSDGGTTNLPSSFVPSNGNRSPGSLNKTVYTLMSDGTNCLNTWITGF